MAGPFVGAPIALETLLSGFDVYMYNVNKFSFGFHLNGQKLFLGGLPSLFDLLPKPTM